MKGFTLKRVLSLIVLLFSINAFGTDVDNDLKFNLSNQSIINSENVDVREDNSRLLCVLENDSEKVSRVACKYKGKTYVKSLKKLAISSLALCAASSVQGVEGGPAAAAMCPFICPAMLSWGCSPFGQAVIIDTVAFFTGGAGVGISPAVVAMCMGGLPATVAACETSCVVTLGIPLWP